MSINSSSVNLQDYYSGGYFLIKANHPGWEQMKNDLLPAKMVSLSQCIAPRLCAYWGWKPNHKLEVLKFGIREDKYDEFTLWSKTEFQSLIDHPSMFYSVEGVRHFIQQFLPDTSDLYIIGVGLPKDVEAMRWREEWSEGEVPHGIEKRIRQHLSLEDGGTVLGFEVASFSYNDFGHSWLCNGLERDMHDLNAIHPNGYGLIDTSEEARKVYEWVAEDEMRGTRAEPEPYDFWLLVSYPLRATDAA